MCTLAVRSPASLPGQRAASYTLRPPAWITVSGRVPVAPMARIRLQVACQPRQDAVACRFRERTGRLGPSRGPIQASWDLIRAGGGARRARSRPPVRRFLSFPFAARGQAVPQHQEVPDDQQHDRQRRVSGEPADAHIGLPEIVNQAGKQDQEDEDCSGEEPGTQSTQYRQWLPPWVARPCRRVGAGEDSHWVASLQPPRPRPAGEAVSGPPSGGGGSPIRRIGSTRRVAKKVP